MITRDSRLLTTLKLLALVLGVLATTITDPAAYGLSDVVMHWIGLLAVVMGTVSGWLSTSPLPGKPKDNYVALPKE